MDEPKPVTRAKALRQHFFRRFFDNDTTSIGGETETAVIRALSFFAVPGLMFAFWLMPSYPNRAIWSVVADRYFFVLFSFVGMATVATFEWEMLFPDRADFLILLPMPLKSRELFVAKGSALLAFLGFFLVATNLFSGILFPAVSTGGHSNFFHTFWIHLTAVTVAGVFAASSMLAFAGLLLCLLPSRWFRPVSTVLQSLSIAALLLLFLLYPLVAGHLEALLSGQVALARFVPPLWFLGLYESLTDGNAAPAASRDLAAIGLVGTGIALGLACCLYPLAWTRQRKRAIEGASSARKPGSIRLTPAVDRWLLKIPERRAVFHFILQTISRSQRYQVFLALYAGAGLALALTSIVTVVPASKSQPLTLALSPLGLHAVLPLLLFWMVAGLRAAFAFPADMLARWVFPISFRPTDSNPSGTASKTLVLLCCGVITGSTLCALLALHWSWRDLMIQAIFGAGLSLLFTDLFFFSQTQIPFTRTRMPGREGLPLVLTLYAALLPAMVLGAVMLERQTEAYPTKLIWIVASVAALHLALNFLDRFALRTRTGSFLDDEPEEGPQLLGLSQ